MKSMAKAILFGGVVLAAQAAMADTANWPGASDDAGITLPARVTYADEHRNDNLASVAPAFAGSAADGVFLTANVTHASEYASNPAVAGSVFPGSADDAGVHLIARRTHADTHLDRSMQAYWPTEGADSNAN